LLRDIFCYSETHVVAHKVYGRLLAKSKSMRVTYHRQSFLLPRASGDWRWLLLAQLTRASVMALSVLPLRVVSSLQRAHGARTSPWVPQSGYLADEVLVIEDSAHTRNTMG